MTNRNKIHRINCKFEQTFHAKSIAVSPPCGLIFDGRLLLQVSKQIDEQRKAMHLTMQESQSKIDKFVPLPTKAINTHKSEKCAIWKMENTFIAFRCAIANNFCHKLTHERGRYD